MSGPTCACSIERCISAIMGGKIPPALLVRIRMAEDAGADDRAFEDHMQIEEDYIFPMLPKEFSVALLYVHKLIREFRARGEKVPKDLFEQHAETERDLFSRLTSRYLQLSKSI